jgi:hypothetical protein
MATQAPIEANRRTAMKSTGPRSVEGKGAARFNALKHCIDARALVIPGEGKPMPSYARGPLSRSTEHQV